MFLKIKILKIFIIIFSFIFLNSSFITANEKQINKNEKEKTNSFVFEGKNKLTYSISSKYELKQLILNAVSNDIIFYKSEKKIEGCDYDLSLWVLAPAAMGALASLFISDSTVWQGALGGAIIGLIAGLLNCGI